LSGRLRAEARLLWVIAGLVVLFGVVAARDATLLQAGTYAAIYAVAAIGLSILLGNVAQISVGQAGFFGIGAYTLGFLMTAATWPAWIPVWLEFLLATLLGTLLAAALGLLLGFIALRFRGHYLAMATLAFGLIAVGLFRESKALGGASGLDNIPFAQFGSLSISGGAAFWYAWGMVAVVVFLTANMLRGRTGRAFEALRNDELAAEVLGVPTRRAKIVAFTFAGALAGLAGTFYSSYLGVVDPNAVGVSLSIDLLLMVVVGGAGGVAGAILGAMLIGISNIYGHNLENWRPVIYGVAVIAIVIAFPRGLAGIILRGRPRSLPLLPSAPDAARVAAGPATPAPNEGATAPRLAVDNVSKRFGGLIAVDGVSFALETGRLTSLIGPNGAGKTTLFNLICGVGRVSSGRVTIAGRDVTGWEPHQIAALGVGRSFQNARLFGDMTVLENVVAGAYRLERTNLASDLLALPASRRSGRRALDCARAVLERLDLTRLANTYARDLAFGDRRRVELARALAADPLLMLVDEPAAGLNASERARLREDLLAIRADGVTVLLIEHDMRLVMQISDRVMVLEFGRLIADGAAGAVRADARVVAAYLGTAH
jgi:branched-chain amino acid transport system permease protein